MSDILNNDVDPIETRDWLQAIESVIREEGVERAQFLIDQVLNTARQGGVSVAAGAAARNYINTIPVEDEPAYPQPGAGTSYPFCYPLERCHDGPARIQERSGSGRSHGILPVCGYHV